MYMDSKSNMPPISKYNNESKAVTEIFSRNNNDTLS